jgi:hypothetical protein
MFSIGRRQIVGRIGGLILSLEGFGTVARARGRFDGSPDRIMANVPRQRFNSVEKLAVNHTADFAKGLPHSQSGEADLSCRERLLKALECKDCVFNNLPPGTGMRLVNPQAAFAVSLEGRDPRTFSCPPAPSVASAEGAAEMVELYWQAVARDVPFEQYEQTALVGKACEELNHLSRLAGPRRDGLVTAATVFRGPSPTDSVGPYLSQFLWKPVPCCSGRMEQRYRVPAAGSDFLQTWSEWLQLQNGVPPWRECKWYLESRYIITGRDLAEYVHYDFLYQAFLNAALILMDSGPGSIYHNGYYFSETNPYKHSKTVTGFVTFGTAQVVDWIARVTTAALKVAWFQKWLVHRRLRPEEFGGLIHRNKTGAAAYPIHQDVMESKALEEIRLQFGAYLLPQAYPEGCPLHPAYPSGHATVAGACATILKAFFDEDLVVPDCVVPSEDGRSLLPYKGPALTVRGEIEKLAFNIAMGRNFAGVHYRSDATAGIRLGEEVAITILEDLVNTFAEDFEGFRFRRFDGQEVHIKKMA